MLRYFLSRRRARAERAQRSSVSLPLEIELLIIDEFGGDVAKLRELCRVCRAWASHAQSLLFREVHVRYKNIGRFLNLLNAGNDVGRYIACLSIIEGSYWQRHDDEFNLLDPLALVIAHKLPNVRTLDISYRYFGMQTATKWDSISRLQVRFCRFPTTDSMVAFIASFPRLDSLDIFQCYTQDVGSKPVKPSIAIPMPAWHFKYLALGEFPQSALIDWMVADPGELAIDKFRILSLGPDASSFNALLAKVGAGLLHLELPGLHRWISGPGASVPRPFMCHIQALFRVAEVALSITPCTELTTLSFSERSAYDLGQGIISVLTQVTSPFLRTVSFQIHLNTGYLDIPWEEIEGVLTGWRFADCLESVVFKMWGGPFEYAVLTPYEEALLLMEERLAVLEARGLLRFNYADDTARCVYMPPLVRDDQPKRLHQRLSRKIAGWMGRGREGRSVRLVTI
ncbi:hypothetical protein C8R43DRAFT_1137720 [Mycena crocata]|nr:hypothetical protein C8R43DRAFT_1137720 [Mycena crocata]